MCALNFTIAFTLETKLIGGNNNTGEIIVVTSDVRLKRPPAEKDRGSCMSSWDPKRLVGCMLRHVYVLRLCVSLSLFLYLSPRLCLCLCLSVSGPASRPHSLPLMVHAN